MPSSLPSRVALGGRLSFVFLFLLGMLAPVAAQVPGDGIANQAQKVSSPKDFLGKQIGADYFLANYTQLTSYWKKLEQESDRIVLEEIGASSYGQKMIVAIISSPENLKKREEFRRISERMARARGLTDATARDLAKKGRAVVWIDAGMHATESVAAQNIIELAYRMVSREDEEARRIRNNVILLVCPANPDGMEMIANGYMATRRVGRIPVLYQRYIGHDNNRDYYLCAQPETENISRMLYRRWYPQILYNHHQSAPRGTIIFTPPFRDPFNFNFDPLTVRGIELVSAHMNSRFTWEGKPGVISRSGARYSTWWNGGLRTTAYFHNIIGILTESFGSPNPTRIRPRTDLRLPFGDHPDPLPAQEWHARQTIEYLQTANFAILDLASKYHAQFLFNIYQAGRNSIRRGSSDHWTVTPRMLAEARRRRDAAQKAASDASGGRGRGEGRGRQGGGRGRGGRGGRGRGGRGRGFSAAVTKAENDTFTDPKLRDARAYLMSADQLDFGAATRFVAALLKTGVEVHRASKAFEAGGKSYPKGSYVVFAAQAFRPHVRDMLEPQWHPDDLGTGGEPVRPYDSAGWTLAMQMGVQYERLQEGLEGPFEAISLADIARPAAGTVTAGKAGWLLAPGNCTSFNCVNRLLAQGEKLARITEPQRVGSATLPVGSIFVARGDRSEERVTKLATEFGLDFVGVDRAVKKSKAIQPVRLGLFMTYGGNMPTGWTEWMLKQFEFPVKPVTGADLNAGGLRENYDVLIFHTGLPDPGGRGRIQRAMRRGRPTIMRDDELKKVVEAMPPFEDWGSIAKRRERPSREEATKALKEFVAGGGTVITVGNQAATAARLFDLPVRTGNFISDGGQQRRARNSEFFIPGSLVNMDIDTTDVMAYGSPKRLAAMFRRGSVFQVQDADKVKVLARYPKTDILASGWAIGADLLAEKPAIVRAKVGSGQIYLFGIDANYRGQPIGTVKLMFNAILNR